MKIKISTLLLTGSLVLVSAMNKCYSQLEIRSLSAKKSSVSSQNNPELHSRTLDFSTEVYRDCPEYTTTEFLKIYSSQIYQVDIISVPTIESLTFPLLSSIPLRNKCNPELKRELVNFTFSDFNPLKYLFDYSTYTDQYFIIDNTSYLVHIAIKQ